MGRRCSAFLFGYSSLSASPPFTSLLFLPHSPSIPPSVQALYRMRVPPPAGTDGERGGSAASERGTGTVSSERLQVLSDLLAITLHIAKEDGRPLDVYRCALDIRRKYRLPIYVPLDKCISFIAPDFHRFALSATRR